MKRKSQQKNWIGKRMKNPLNKRILRELKHDFGKYFVIFMFMVLLISLVSGFLVADNSVVSTYYEGFTKYNLEDGHLSFNMELPESVQSSLEEKGNVTLYNLNYYEENLESGATLRIYQNREEVDLECLMSGTMASKKNEIVLDRMFARNANIEIGDTITLNKKEFKVTGMIAMVDYSSLFEKASDSMFDSINFGVASMSKEGIEYLNSTHITYNYAWTYPETIERTDKQKAKSKSDDFTDVLEDVIKEYDKNLVEEAIDAGKLRLVHEVLEKMESQYGSLSGYNTESGRKTLLTMINSALDAQGIDLEEEFDVSDSDLDLDPIEITTKDIQKAFDASQKELDQAKECLDTIEDRILDVEDYLPRYLNQAVNFVGDDAGSDKAMFVLFDYIVVAVLAFVFAVTISNTITSESTIIGTLRASGYTKGELIAHYMVLPVMITFIAAIIGNILGYTLLEDFFKDVYYNSYSLATYESLFNMEAFIDTTIIPIVLMFGINLFVLIRKLSLSPLKFIRKDLSRKKNRKAFPLSPKMKIMNRFKLRILFQNIPNYLTLFLGIFLGGALVVFGLMFGPLLDNYSQSSVDARICDYQYVLKEEVETENQQAEKFCMTSLNTTNENYLEDEISVYGIEKNSEYITQDISSGKVLISSAFANKFQLGKGDSFTLKDAYNGKVYSLEVDDIYDYEGGLLVLMPIDEYRTTFKESDTYFNGYFSNEKLDDIDSDAVMTIIDVSDLTKLADQMKVSMGDFMGLIKYFGIIMFLLLMYILSKQIIEKNAQSISMTKILGFTNTEISLLYILSTSIVVVLSLLISIPIIDHVLAWAFSSYIYTEMTGYIPYMIDYSCFVEMVFIGIVCYALISAIQYYKINKIPKSDALKNAE